jgi:hypothetical protein
MKREIIEALEREFMYSGENKFHQALQDFQELILILQKYQDGSFCDYSDRGRALELIGMETGDEELGEGVR